jgi:thioredoxin 1
MQKMFLLVSVFVVLSLLSSFVTPKNLNGKGGIVFFKGSWKAALQKAKTEKKTIFLEIGASWCGPCHKLKAKTFTNAKVAKYFNENFINVTLDGEDGGDGTMLAEKYKLAYFPSLYFIDTSGNVIKAGNGYYNSKEILQFAKILN